MALALEILQVVHHETPEEGASALQRRLVDNHLGTFCLDALHHALDAALAEVVAVALHREAVYANGARLLFCLIVVVLVGIVVVASHVEHAVGDEILAGAVALHDGLNQVLRHVGIVGEQLLGILWQTVAAISEGWVVIESADSRVQSHTVDNGLGVESLHFGVCIQLVEVAHSQGEVGVGEELHCLSLGESHEEGVDVLLDGSLLQQGCEDVGCLVEAFVAIGSAHDDAARVEVVVEGLALAQEFGCEDDVVAVHLLADVLGVAHWDGALDNHDGIGIHLFYEFYHLFYV